MFVIQELSAWYNFRYYKGKHVPEEIQLLNLDLDVSRPTLSPQFKTKCAIC